jgi:AraC-like DNA-binding protein
LFDIGKLVLQTQHFSPFVLTTVPGGAGVGKLGNSAEYIGPLGTLSHLGAASEKKEMVGSSTLVFSEPEDFETALGAEGCIGLWITGPGGFRARLVQVLLHRLRLSTIEEQLPRVVFIAVPADMVMMSFPIGIGTAPVYGGMVMRSGEVMTLGPGQRMHARTDGPCSWGTIWFPLKELVQNGRALTGAPFAVPPFVQCWRPPQAAGKDLFRLHAAGIRIAEIRPRALADAEAAHGLEQQMIHALVECLTVASTDVGTVAARQHRDIMVRFEHLLQTEPHRNMRMVEISAALGVSERLLRILCVKHLGMSGKHYLRVRRMSLVRRALRHGNGQAAGVAAVARDYGFADARRFAVEYRALFSELPSTTLRRLRPK